MRLFAPAVCTSAAAAAPAAAQLSTMLMMMAKHCATQTAQSTFRLLFESVTYHRA